MSDHSIPKIRTGMPGLDHVTHGGLPEKRLTMVSGTSGSGKTILAAQFLVRGIEEEGAHGVMVTFEESADDMRRSLASLGWDIPRFEEQGQLRFIDASMAEAETVTTGDYDLGALLVRLEHAVNQVGARRVALDSTSALFLQFRDTSLVRRELLRISLALKKLGVTSMMTAEREADYGGISRFGVEEYVADNVIILRHVMEDEKRRRTVEIFKSRGSSHQQGEVPFTIVGGEGIVVLPLGEIELAQASTEKRITSGDDDLDRMCGGGFFQDSVILVTGATGTGKTLLSTEFASAGVEAGERVLLFGYEESRDQLIRNARGWGRDFPAMEERGLLRVECRYPETAGLEDHLHRIRRASEEFQAQRVVIDSVTALQRISSQQAFREFLLNITAFLKQRQIAGFVTSTTGTLAGALSASDSNISTLTDTIILLRYLELEGSVHRGLTVLKMRGSAHEKSVREFTIDGSGIRIGEPMVRVQGVLTSAPRPVPTEDEEAEA